MSSIEDNLGQSALISVDLQLLSQSDDVAITFAMVVGDVIFVQSPILEIVGVADCVDGKRSAFARHGLVKGTGYI